MCPLPRFTPQSPDPTDKQTELTPIVKAFIADIEVNHKENKIAQGEEAQRMLAALKQLLIAEKNILDDIIKYFGDNAASPATIISGIAVFFDTTLHDRKMVTADDKIKSDCTKPQIDNELEELFVRWPLLPNSKFKHTGKLASYEAIAKYQIKSNSDYLLACAITYALPALSAVLVVFLQDPRSIAPNKLNQLFDVINNPALSSTAGFWNRAGRAVTNAGAWLFTSMASFASALPGQFKETIQNMILGTNEKLAGINAAISDYAEKHKTSSTRTPKK